MQTVKRRWRWVFALVLACAVSLLAWVTPPPEKNLLVRATKVSGVQANQDIHPYGWLSNHELLRFYFMPDGSWSLSCYDLTGRRESPLPALTALYRKSGGDENGSPPLISPDGKHLLWINRKNQVFCSDLGGTTFSHQTQQPGWSSPCWLDNTHWALLKEDKNDIHLLAIETHDVRVPNVSRHLLLSPPIMLRRSSDTELPRLTLTPGRSLFELLATFSQFTPVRVNEFAIASRRVTERTHFLPLPQKPSRPFLIASEQSPTNGRVAFVLLFQPDPPFWQPLLHLLKMKDRPDAVGSLCVGDPETGQVHEVGHITVDGFAGYGPIGDVRWMPDGKHLSFLSGHELFTVPAD